MLVFNLAERISVDDAIAHEFFEDLHFEEDEPITSYVSAFDFDFEKYDLTIEQTKEEIYEEIMLYHSTKAQKRYLENRQKYPHGMLYLKYTQDKPDNAKEKIKDALKSK